MFRRATYRILVRGRVAADWAERLWGMRISTDTTADGGVLTTLEGELRDQAALSGVLNNLYELHLPILEVERVRENV